MISIRCFCALNLLRSVSELVRQRKDVSECLNDTYFSYYQSCFFAMMIAKPKVAVERRLLSSRGGLRLKKGCLACQGRRDEKPTFYLLHYNRNHLPSALVNVVPIPPRIVSACVSHSVLSDFATPWTEGLRGMP